MDYYNIPKKGKKSWEVYMKLYKNLCVNVTCSSVNIVATKSISNKNGEKHKAYILCQIMLQNSNW
jgi:hypothetical protein